MKRKKRPHTTPTPKKSKQKYNPIPILIITIFLLALFSQTAAFEFLWDDARGVIRDNPILTPPSISKTLQAWIKPHSDLYMPFTYTVWSFLAAISDTLFHNPQRIVTLHPAVFHIGNVLIHLFSTLLVWHIIRTITARLIKIKLLTPPPPSTSFPNYPLKTQLPLHELPPLLAALIYAIHPLQVEPLAWCSGMKDLLAAVLSFSTIALYLKALEKQNPTPAPLFDTRSLITSRPYLLATLTLILALCSKAHAVVTLPICLILDLCLYRRGKILHTLLPLIPWGLLVFAFILIARQLQPNERILFITPLWARPFIAGDTLFFYLQKLLLPIQLCFDYGRTPQYVLSQSFFWWHGIIPLILLIAAAIPRTRTLFLLPLLIFYLGFLSVSGLIPFFSQRMSTVSDRYATIALLGPALAIALLTLRHPRTIIPITLIILPLLAIRTHVQLQHWRNEYSLCTHALSINPQSWMAHNNLGMHYLDQQQDLLAEKHLRLSIQYYPNYHDAHINLGVALNNQGRYQEAAESLLKSIAIRNTIAPAHNNLAFSYNGLGRYDEAIAAAQHAIRLDPLYSSAHFNLARAYIEKGKGLLDDKAEHHILTGLRSMPNDPLAHFYLAYICKRQGRHADALRYAQIAASLDPANPQYRGFLQSLTAHPTPKIHP